ncbi:hypothetical protein [Inquilinus limosus]|uniref:hypothetical protein n=1 Tax=Inquilinus limosus TaxID=171674 RepID=UPI00047C591C|nr:hypothetical protein [Inquilinus limosus]
MAEDQNHTLLLGRVEGKLDMLIADVRKMAGQHSELETRVTALERWRYYVIGAAAAISFALQYVDITKVLSLK